MNASLPAFRLSRQLVIIWFVALLSASGYYALNRLALGQLRSGQPMSTWLNGGATVVASDDEYYITPPENWLAGHGWRRSPAVGHGAYTRRTPGYSLWYLAHRLAVGPERVYWALLVSQLVLFAFTAVAFAATLRRLVRTAWVRTGANAIFVLSPWFLSYEFYTITEALSVPLLVFELYWAVRAYQATTAGGKAGSYAVAAALWSMASLTRPFAGLSALLLGTLLVADYLVQPTRPQWGLLVRHALLASVVPLVLFGTWTTRNYLVAGDLVILERYSHPESIDGFKPAFNAAWDLYTAAGVKEMDFYRGIPLMYTQLTLSGQPDSALIEKTLAIVPADKRADIGGDVPLRTALQAYQRLLLEQYHPYVVNPVRPMPAQYSSEELAVVQQFSALRKQLYQREPWMRLLDPLLVVKEAVLHSNTSSLSLFDQRIRSEYWPINLLRLLLLATHLALYAGLAVGWVQVLRRRNVVWHLGLLLPPTVLLLLLAFWVHTTEQRYMLPFLAFMLLNAALLVDKWRQPAVNPAAASITR